MYHVYRVVVEQQDPDVHIIESNTLEFADEALAVRCYNTLKRVLPGDSMHDDPIKDIPSDAHGPGLYYGEHIKWDESYDHPPANHDGCYWYVYIVRDRMVFPDRLLHDAPPPPPPPIVAYWVTVTVTGVAMRLALEFQGPVSGKRAAVSAFRAICEALMDRHMSDRELDAAITDIPASPDWRGIFQGDWTVYQEGEEPDEDVYWSIRLDKIKTAYAI